MRGDVPQTVAAALEQGWLWLNVQCDDCHHRAQRRLDEFTVSQSKAPMARLVRKLRCTRCEGRSVSLSLGTWLSAGDQPQPHTRRIGIEGDLTVAPGRE